MAAPTDPLANTNMVIPMRAHELIRLTRERAGLSDTAVAARVQLLLAAYDDVEDHADEFVSAVSCAQAKAICAALNLNFADVVALEFPALNVSARMPTEFAGVARSTMLRRKREMLGLSEAALADSIGYEAVAIQRAEQEESFLDTLPIQVLADLADKLNLPVLAFIA